MASAQDDQSDRQHQAIRKEIRELAQKVRVPVIVDRIWRFMLTEQEREIATKAPNMGPDIIDIWAKLKSLSPVRATLELARDTDLLSGARCEQLLQAVGEETLPSGTSQPKPEWNRDRGELRFGTEIIRTIRGVTVAKNVVAILDAFQEENWPDRIDDPIHNGPDGHRMREAIRSLNRGLKKMCFRADGTGTGVTWEPC